MQNVKAIKCNIIKIRWRFQQSGEREKERKIAHDPI